MNSEQALSGFKLQLPSETLATLRAMPPSAKRQTSVRTSHCPLKYMLNIEYAGKGSEDMGTPYMRAMSRWHQWAADYGKHCLANREQSDIAFGKQSAADAAQDVGEYAKDFIDLADNMLSFGPPFAPDSKLEMHLSLLPDSTVTDTVPNDYLFTGTVDRAWYDQGEKSLQILDYKGDRHTPPAGELIRHFQVLSYAGLMAMLFMQRTKIVPQEIDATLFYTRSGIFRRVEYSIEELIDWWRGEFRNRLIYVAHLVSANIRDARPFDGYEGCQGCLHIGVCPMKLIVEQQPEAMVEADPPKAAELMIFAKALAARLDAPLREWVNLHGSIPVGPEVLGFAKVTRREYGDPSQVAAMLAKVGVTAEMIIENIGFTQSDVKKLVEKGTFDTDIQKKAFLAAASELLIETEQTHFKCFEPGKAKKGKKATT